MLHEGCGGLPGKSLEVEIEGWEEERRVGSNEAVMTPALPDVQSIHAPDRLLCVCVFCEREQQPLLMEILGQKRQDGQTSNAGRWAKETHSITFTNPFDPWVLFIVKVNLFRLFGDEENTLSEGK